MLRCHCPVLCLLISLFSSAFGQWKPLDPAQAALKAPSVDPRADAEVLLWEVRIEDTVQSSDVWVTFDHYLRIKIFTDKGAKEQSTVEIPFGGKTTISNLTARTIQEDGSIVEAGRDATKETDVVKGKRSRSLKQRTIAFPAVKPGSIIEYRYREVRMNELASHLQLSFSRDLPVHEVRYLIKPIDAPWMPYTMRSMDFHVQRTPFSPTSYNGTSYALTSMKNVPAFKPEPRMPPENDVRPWIYIYYEKDRKLTSEKFWKETGKEYYEELSKSVKMDGHVKKLAAELTASLNTPEEKAKAILQFCQIKVRSLFGPEISAQEREKFKPNRNTADTLKQMIGTGGDKLALFVALGQAAGLDARFVLGADRGWKLFSPNMMSPSFLRSRSVAVKTPNGWKFYDPALRLTPAGMLRWQEEQTMALIADGKEPEIVPTSLSDVDKSVATRTGELHLDEKGGIEGTINISFTGHLATDRRADLFDDTPEERIEKVKEELTDQYAGATVTEVKAVNVDDPEKPLVYSAKISVEGYAQRTGKRLFVQPSFFAFGKHAMFAESERKYDVFFEFPWSEVDRVTLHLPEGFTLDTPMAPQSSNFGGVGGYQAKLAMTQDGRDLIYSREFVFGKEGRVAFPVSAYPTLKQVFDFVHQQDGHTMVLKAAN